MEQNMEQVPAVKKTSSAAIVSLVTGIFSWVVLFFHDAVNVALIPALIIAPISALIAVIFGIRGRHQVRDGGGAVTGKVMANVGMILGWVYLIIGIILLALVILGLTTLIGSLGNLGI